MKGFVGKEVEKCVKRQKSSKAAGPDDNQLVFYGVTLACYLSVINLL